MFWIRNEEHNFPIHSYLEACFIVESGGSETTPNPMCLNRSRYPIDIFERCLCEAHIPVTVGNWSECILEPSSESYYKTTRSFPGKARIFFIH